jgi:Mrp family chromosome partitioning ATPase/DUF971 family protein
MHRYRKQCVLLLLLVLAIEWQVQAFGIVQHHSRPLVHRLLSRSSSHVLRMASNNDDSTTTDAHEDTAVTHVPIPNEWQGAVLTQLQQVIDPDLNKDIVTLGFVQQLRLDETTRTVSFHVELTTPACPVKEVFASECQSLVEALPWVQHAQVTMTAQAPASATTNSPGMAQIGAIVAVSSCKGGVGKSTTAVNLAFSLQALGATVGILDADVYGPSLPTMIVPQDDVVRFVGRSIAPLQRNGVRLMSFGYINEGSAVMRGPMVTQLLDQLLNVIHWGPLDYLILDMPPGTGDIPLTLTQRLNITAAVIVTTPQELSFADVVRGVEMFDSVNVPCIAVVENMAYYEVETTVLATNTSDTSSNTTGMTPEATAQLKAAFQEKLTAAAMVDATTNGNAANPTDALAQELVDLVTRTLSTSPPQLQTVTEKVYLFGPGHRLRLSQQWGMEHTFSIPLLDRIAAHGDNGTPYVVQHPTSPAALVYRTVAQAVVTEVAKLKYERQQAGASRTLTYDADAHVLQLEGAMLQPAHVRRQCKCASCVEELTGRQILMPFMIPDNVKPINMAPTGNYAVSIDWSDGHRSLYPYRQLRSLVQAQQQQQAEKEAATSDTSSPSSDKSEPSSVTVKEQLTV